MYRFTSHERFGGDLLFGTTWFAAHYEGLEGGYANGDVPGAKSYGPADVVNYVVSGTLRVTYSRPGEESVTVDVGADEALYLARGWVYHKSNPFDEPVYFVY